VVDLDRGELVSDRRPPAEFEEDWRGVLQGQIAGCKLPYAGLFAFFAVLARQYLLDRADEMRAAGCPVSTILKMEIKSPPSEPPPLPASFGAPPAPLGAPVPPPRPSPGAPKPPVSAPLTAAPPAPVPAPAPPAPVPDPPVPAPPIESPTFVDKELLNSNLITFRNILDQINKSRTELSSFLKQDLRDTAENNSQYPIKSFIFYTKAKDFQKYNVNLMPYNTFIQLDDQNKRIALITFIRNLLPKYLVPKYDTSIEIINHTGFLKILFLLFAAYVLQYKFKDAISISEKVRRLHEDFTALIPHNKYTDNSYKYAKDYIDLLNIPLLEKVVQFIQDETNKRGGKYNFILLEKTLDDTKMNSFKNTRAVKEYAKQLEPSVAGLHSFTTKELAPPQPKGEQMNQRPGLQARHQG
jgi:hypothetical protein